jgi:hypothetical protein
MPRTPFSELSLCIALRTSPMPRKVRGSAMLLAAALAAFSRPAFAQGAGDQAGAQELFDEGRALASAGRFAEACSKFAASEQLAPSGGTLLNLADCYEKNGQFASAWATFHEVEARARRAGRLDIEKLADERVKQLEPKVAFLSIVVPAGAVVDGLEVRRDGEVVPRGAWATELPVDGGVHRVEAKAPGKQTRTLSVRVAPSAERATVTVPPLEDLPSPPVSAPPSTEAPAAPRSTTSGGGMPFSRIMGLGLGGGGIVAMGVASAFGVTAISKNSAALPYCPASPQCNDPRGVQLTNDARTAATVSTVLFAAGGALVAAGAVLFLTSPSASARAANPGLRVGVAIGPLGAKLGAAW